MAGKFTARDARTFQAALTAVEHMIHEHGHDPRIERAEALLTPYLTSLAALLAIGMAAFLGVDVNGFDLPVTTDNWDRRLRAATAWPAVSEDDRRLGDYALSRHSLTPEELTRVRALIEKLERLGRQGRFNFDVIDDDRPF